MSRREPIEHNGELTTLRDLSKRLRINYNALQKRWRKGDRGERLVRPVETKPGGFIFFCDWCGCEFHRHHRGYRFCGRKCANAGRQLKLTRDQVEQIALKGTKATAVCAAFNIDPVTLRRCLREYGLYRAWQQARYAKCKVGNTQSTPRRESQIGTASSARAGNTPSARSEGRTASAMSCG